MLWRKNCPSCHFGAQTRTLWMQKRGFPAVTFEARIISSVLEQNEVMYSPGSLSVKFADDRYRGYIVTAIQRLQLQSSRGQKSIFAYCDRCSQINTNVSSQMVHRPSRLSFRSGKTPFLPCPASLSRKLLPCEAGYEL